MNRARKSIVAAGLTAGLIGGGVAGAVFGTPLLVGAQNSETSTTTTEEPTTTTVDKSKADKTDSDKDKSDSAGKDDAKSDDNKSADAPESDEGTSRDKGTTPDGSGDKADRTKGHMGRFDSVLDELVGNGTITSDQADAIKKAFSDARGQRGEGRGWMGKGHRGDFGGKGFFDGPDGEMGRSLQKSFKGLREAYEALGMTPDELFTQLKEGKTLADIARSKGVDPQKLIDDITAPIKAFSAEAVKEGRMTQEQADRRVARAVEQVTKMVNEGWSHKAGD